MFISENTLIGGGHDCTPLLFQCDNGWTFITQLDSGKEEEKVEKSAFAAKLEALRSKVDKGETKSPSASSGNVSLITTHQNVINSLMPCHQIGAAGDMIDRFTSTGLDGKIVAWTLNQ